TGMAPEVCSRIFEPFFTTKAVGEGTGLGLAIVHSIIEMHHGRIEVESAPDQGSTFRIIIPNTQPMATAKRA
ncbi:MAG TPA: ATP-binding protein, partial [Flavobacteriales bacterium]|nr:ATP-binding protein [Flavobacteriales bacterium]